MKPNGTRRTAECKELPRGGAEVPTRPAAAAGLLGVPAQGAEGHAFLREVPGVPLAPVPGRMLTDPPSSAWRVF